MNRDDHPKPADESVDGEKASTAAGPEDDTEDDTEAVEDGDGDGEWLEDDDDAGEDIPGSERPRGFFDHLEELRWTLIKCVIVFGVFVALIGFFLKESNELLLWPLHQVQAEAGNASLSLDLGTHSIMESFTIVIQMCCMGGLVLGLPFMFFFVGQFVAPALHEREKKRVLPVCLSALLLFVIGAAFSFFLLVPGTIRVSVGLNHLFGFVTRWTPEAYYSLLMWLVPGVGAAFEFPLLIVVLVWMGLLTTRKLVGWWRHALLVIFIIAAIVTPTPDPVTQTVLATPLYALYWLAILVGRRVEKRRERREAGLSSL
ncbi:MAG: twin-arginine translocase subunit TatC [Opitutaceae bacterium]|nr:twin-arginine translocase subunit TatC [Opitutaceae bacterium]